MFVEFYGGADWLVRGNNPDETLMIAVKALDRAEFSVSPLSRIALARKIGSSNSSTVDIGYSIKSDIVSIFCPVFWSHLLIC